MTSHFNRKLKRSDRRLFGVVCNKSLSPPLFSDDKLASKMVTAAIFVLATDSTRNRYTGLGTNERKDKETNGFWHQRLAVVKL